MKTMVKLAVLMATLLLVAGVALAEWCECYEINYTSLDGVGGSGTFGSVICFDYDNKGNANYFCTPPCTSGPPLYMFFDSMNKEAIMYTDAFGQCTVYFKFHGDDNYAVTGITDSAGYRYEFRGHQVDMDYCMSYCH
jgi:hypothetical protein